MTKFNQTPSVGRKVANHPDVTTNYEGGVAFKTNAKNELYLRCATWLVNEPKFYGDNQSENAEIRNLIDQISAKDPEFILRLAAYLRNEMYLRSAPMFLLVESLAYPETKKLVRKWIPHIIKRADELSEVIALFIAKNGEIGTNGKSSLPNQFKLGLADAFSNFNEYQFGKYKMSDKNVKLVDALRLVHPIPRDTEQSALFKRIRTGTLAVPETWETVISEKGNTTEAWNSVIPKMGYMAKLRNLRNIAQADADIVKVLDHIVNPIAIKNSKQFPYRFLNAYKMIEQDIEDPFKKKVILNALELAMTTSVQNIPHLSGNTLVSVDNSGSMEAPLSEKSKIERKEVGAVMGAMANGFCDVGVASVFGTYFKVVDLSGKSILQDAKKMIDTNVDSSTNGFLVLKYLVENKLHADRAMIFTDEQLWDSTNTNDRNTIWGTRSESLYKWFLKYKAMQPNFKLYLFDLAGYGTVQIPDSEPNVAIIGGFSDRIFDFIKRFEEDRSKVLEAIETYNPTQKTEDED